MALKTATYCFLCKEGVSPSSEGGHPLDPCMVTLITKADRPEDEQDAQVLFCHFRCFREVAGGLLFLDGGDAGSDEL